VVEPKAGAKEGSTVVDARYEAYCMADPVFYDNPRRMVAEKVSTTGHPDFAVSKRPVPDGWHRHAGDEWVMLAPEDARMPVQGWKVHVSACLDNSDEVLASIWDYCVTADLPFKYLAGRQVFFLRNSKYADRGGSGKLVTIYPADDARFKSVLEELDAIVGGQPGPYVLSDLRWNDGPLYVRYGGFAARFRTTPGGDREPVIEAPDKTLVPDRRNPVFTVPPWVGVPGCLEPALTARNAVTFEGVPYVPEKALHFSNGGGVYLARSEKTGEKVVLKEARPHAGLAPDGSGAVARLRRERDVIRCLDGVPGVPGYVGYFTVADHEFLVEQFIEGQPLFAAINNRNPLMRNEMSEQRAGDFAGAVETITRTVNSEYISHAGMFTGRAGAIVALGQVPAAKAALDRQVRALGWHALTHRGEIAFPGDYLLRLSVDLATGSAGILLALDTVLRTGGGTLPFLAPTAVGASKSSA
jgi:hypothetical protein